MKVQKHNRYFKGRYIISFYSTDELNTLIATFDNIYDICKYKGLVPNKENYNQVRSGLYQALKREKNLTYFLNGKPAEVYLIDINENEEEIKKEEIYFMKNFVRIQSNINIVVTAGLQSINMSNKDAHVADRLSVKSGWVGTRIQIRKGAHYYPAIIKDWDSVKSLVKDKYLTIGELVDTIDEAEEQTNAAAMQKQLDKHFAKIDSMMKTAKDDPQATEINKSQISF